MCFFHSARTEPLNEIMSTVNVYVGECRSRKWRVRPLMGRVLLSLSQVFGSSCCLDVCGLKRTFDVLIETPDGIVKCLVVTGRR